MKFKNKLLIIHILFIFILNISITSLATTLENNVQSTPNSTEQISKENENLELNLYSKSCILIELSTNRVAYEKNAKQ